MGMYTVHSFDSDYTEDSSGHLDFYESGSEDSTEYIHIGDLSALISHVDKLLAGWEIIHFVYDKLKDHLHYIFDVDYLIPEINSALLLLQPLVDECIIKDEMINVAEFNSNMEKTISFFTQYRGEDGSVLFGNKILISFYSLLNQLKFNDYNGARHYLKEMFLIMRDEIYIVD